MKDFFKNKRNIVLLSLLIISVIFIVLNIFIVALTPVTCILIGLWSLYVAWMFFIKTLREKNSKLKEFDSNDDQKEKKKMLFFEAESKTNRFLLLFSFGFIGVILVYYGIKMLI